MYVLNFQKQFAAAVESGQKRQTIRARRKNGQGPKPGDHLRLYTGMRTKQCRKLKDVECIAVEQIRITEIVVDNGHDQEVGIVVIAKGKQLTIPEATALAKEDGFYTPDDFVNFFADTHGLPFEGLLIRWH